MIKLLSLFSGIGAFERALEKLNIKYEIMNYCEVDKYASKAYSILHNVSENLNLGDITKIDFNTLPPCDMITYGFPCQDISISGYQKGLANGTRSSLVFNALKVIEHCKPKYAICENVKNLVSKKFKTDVNNILQLLDKMGYNSYYDILDSKDFGIPQHRERVFIISIRKDIDTKDFTFPKGFKLTKCLKDIILENVDKKYFLSKQLKTFLKMYKFTPKKHNNIMQIIGIPRPNGGYRQSYRVYSPAGIAPTLNTCEGGGRHAHIELDSEIRKLTPHEYFILQGFNKSDVDLLQVHGISDSQLYKIAGNSICVAVLEHIFKNLLGD